MTDVTLMVRVIQMDDEQFDTYTRTFSIHGTALRDLSELRDHWRSTMIQIHNLPTV